MTTVRPILKRLLAVPSGLARRAWSAIAANSRTFFEPLADCVTRDAKGAGQAAQGTVLMISTQDRLTLLGRVAIRLRMLTTAPSAVGTQKALFAILRQAIARQFVAAAVNTLQCEHVERVYLLSRA